MISILKLGSIQYLQIVDSIINSYKLDNPEISDVLFSDNNPGGAGNSSEAGPSGSLPTLLPRPHRPPSPPRPPRRPSNNNNNTNENANNDSNNNNHTNNENIEPNSSFYIYSARNYRRLIRNWRRDREDITRSAGFLDSISEKPDYDLKAVRRIS